MKTAMKTLAILAALGLLTACGGSEHKKQLKAAEKAAAEAIANMSEAEKEAAAKADEAVRKAGAAANLPSDEIDDTANQSAEAARQAVKAQGK